HTTGTISHGNVYFQDSQGNTAFGTIKNGNVFLNTSKGNVMFGTIKNGNVFLTDANGTTTGTVRNGFIFLNSSDGSTTTGSCSANHVYTTTTPSDTTTQERQQQERREQQQQQSEERQRQIDRENYEAGRAIGESIGSAIAGGMASHRISSYCKKNPTGTYLTGDGFSVDCPNAPFDSWEQQQVDAYCNNNPGSYTGFGRHMVDCVTPPNPPTLKWATWE